MRKAFAILVLSSIFYFSCTTQPIKNQNTASEVNIDSLVAAWNSVWNNHDSAAIVNMMHSDIIYIGDGKIQKGIDTVAKKFVGPYSKLINNLNTDKLSAGVSGNQAYYYGTYTHDVALKDTTLKNRNGIFSVIFIKDQNQWKTKLVDIAENFK